MLSSRDSDICGIEKVRSDATSRETLKSYRINFLSRAINLEENPARGASTWQRHYVRILRPSHKNANILHILN